MVIAGCGSGQSCTGVSDGTNTYTGYEVVTHTSFTYKLSQYVAVNVTGGTKTITASFSAGTGFPWIIVFEISGCSASPLDGHKSAYQAPAGSGTDGITTGTTTNSNQPALIVGFQYGSPASYPGTSMSFDTYGSDAGDNVAFEVTWSTEYRRVTSTGSFAATWTDGGGATVATIMAIFDEASGSTGKLTGSLVCGSLIGVLA
jgi:hypothetical protein